MADYTIDAKGRPLGRVASEIAGILQGKRHPSYNPRVVGADRVLLQNASGIIVTGKKQTGKTYFRHTGYMGHLKSLTFEQAFARNPENVLRQAVRRMLPKNFLNQRRLKNLVFVDKVKK